MTEIPDMSVEIATRTCACWMRIRWYLREFSDQPKVALSLKTRMVKAGAIEALLYGCSTLSRCESLGLYRIMYGNRAMEVQRRNIFVVGSDNTEMLGS